MLTKQNILKLSVAERLLLLEELWNTIPGGKIQVTDSQKKELDRRLVRLKKEEPRFFTWDEVKKELHSK